MLALYIVVGLTALLVVILCIPVQTEIIIDTSAEKNISLRVSWFFGLVKKNISKSKKLEDKQIRKKRRFFASGIDLSVLSKVRDTAGLVRQLKSFGINVFRQLRVGEISGDFIVGLEDPAYTGMLFAVVGPVNTLLNMHPKYNVGIRPVFDDEYILEGNLDGSVKILPIRLTLPVIRLVTSPDVLKTGTRLIKDRRKQRRKTG